jgi:PDZ domain-containing secreted protein
MSKVKLVLFLTVFSLWVINCSAAGEVKQEREIVVEKIENGITLGLVITDVDTKDKKDLETSEGALVLHVIEDSQAEKAGLQKEDIVVEFEGEKIEDAKELNDLVEAIKEERNVNLAVLRDGKRKNIKATLKEGDEDKHINLKIIGEGDRDSWTWETEESDGELGDAMVWVDDEDGMREVMVSSSSNSPGGHSFSFGKGGKSKGGFLGVMTDNISGQMLEYFEVDHGVLVKEVVKGSPAEKAGLKAGDVITFIEDRKIEDYADLTRTISFFNPEEEVEVTFVRKGSKKNIDVKLAGKKNKFRSGPGVGSNMFIFSDDDESVQFPGVHVKGVVKGKPFMFRKFGAGKYNMNIFVI